MKTIFVTNFKEKAEFFDTVFVKQYSLINNKRLLPAYLNFLTENCLSVLKFTPENVSRIIQNLDLIKAHQYSDAKITRKLN